jgi:hypothetical protein
MRGHRPVNTQSVLGRGAVKFPLELASVELSSPDAELSWEHKYLRYTHKTSGFKTSGFKMSGFKTSSFKMSGLQNVRCSKRQVSKCLVSKRPVFKFDILIKQKV